MHLSDLTINSFLTICGILVLLLCLFLIFTQRGAKFKERQILRGFGLELEISVLTLLVLVGFTLSLASIYLQMTNYQSLLAKAQENSKSLELALRQASKIDAYVLVTLEGVNSREMPRLDDIYCQYYSKQKGGWSKATVESGLQGNEFLLTLNDINPQMSVERIELRYKDPTQKVIWVKKEAFYPLTQSFQLKKED
ncbi:MAG TPA: hypothetical protein VF553_01185 [Pyrinomonadaceae bacterium]|jgi:hypothetical protein